LLTRLVSLHERKRDIGPLGWLAQNPEPGQSFAEFARALGPTFEPSRSTVYVVGIGDFPAGRAPLLDTASSFLAGFFGLGSRRLEDLSLGKLPRRARRQHPAHGHLQYHAGEINSLLLSRGVPSDAAAVIGLTNVDLWPGGDWNFVFGLSSLTQRVGVWSLARLGDPTRENVISTRFLWRTVRTAVHECGHLLGMRHCTAYECGMNGANGLQEFDMQPLEFCPECQAKIVLISGADPKQRYQRLADFATRFRMPAEAGYWRSAQQVLSTNS
jgi:archaemetzincin